MKKISLSILSIIFFLIFVTSNSAAQDKIDQTSTKLIKAYTTKPDFLSPLVDYIPESKTVLSPRDFLGYVAGTPKKLTYANDIHRYFYELSNRSNRIRVIEIGKSNEGRARILTVIADEKTLADIDKYKEYMKMLTDPRLISEEKAQETIKKAKPMYLITGGLHSTETGSPEMLMELAYRIIVSDSPKLKSIRENLITLIIPVLEVDGREKVVDWYYRYTINRTDWEDGFPSSPPYWGTYTFHDNNREGIQISQPLTQQMSDVFFEYYPIHSLDLHESVPLLYLSSGTGPYNPNIDPITTTEFQLFSNYELSELTKYGMPGVWTWGFYTGWYPGYLLWITANHNATGRFYETFGNAGANTFERKINQKFANKSATSKQWYRPIPPPKKLKWSFRNNINYMESGVIAGLYFASQNGELLLGNFWKKGCNAVNKGKEEKPYAWLITPNQKKKDMFKYLLSQLQKQRIEIYKSNRKIKYAGKEYPKGTIIVRMDQPYGPFAKNLLEVQKFPTDAEHRPYDDISWTLGLQYGVETIQVDSASILKEPMTKLESTDDIELNFPKTSSPNYYIVPNNGSPSMISLRYAIKDIEVFAAEKSFTVGTDTLLPGSWIIPANTADSDFHSRFKEAAKKFSIDVLAFDEKLDIPMHSLDLPQLAVYHNWLRTQDTGWFRFTIEQYDIPYTLINDDVLREGNLNSKFDVIIVPELGRSANPKSLIHGIDEKFSPLPYTQTARFTSHGYIDQTDDMTKGMGFEGLKNLEEYIINGGLLVALGGGSILPVELGLVTQVSRVSSKVVNPGSFVKIRILQRDNPITYGYKELTHIFTGNSPLFNVRFKDRDLIVMQYGKTLAKEDVEENQKEKAKEKDICLSGMIKNHDQLIQNPAILSIPRKSGRVVIFNFNPAHRFLNHHDFGYVFNTIMNWNDLSID